MEFLALAASSQKKFQFANDLARGMTNLSFAYVVSICVRMACLGDDTAPVLLNLTDL